MRRRPVARQAIARRCETAQHGTAAPSYVDDVDEGSLMQDASALLAGAEDDPEGTLQQAGPMRAEAGSRGDVRAASVIERACGVADRVLQQFSDSLVDLDRAVALA